MEAFEAGEEEKGSILFDIATEVSDTIPINSVDDLNLLKMDACFTAFDKDG